MCLEKIFLCLGKPLVPGDRIFDAHCHVFNLEYLVLEIGQIIFDMIRGSYPRLHEDERLNALALFPQGEGRPLIEEAEDLLQWILEIGEAALDSEADNARMLSRAARRSWRVKNLNCIPLMMDIYYIFAPPLRAPGDAGGAAEAALRKKPILGQSAPSASSSGASAQALPSAQDAQAELRTRLSAIAKRAELELDMEPMIEKIIAPKLLQAGSLPSFHMTAGFEHQFHAIKALGQAGKGIYPFFALDPRRPGAIQWLLDSGMVGSGGPFYGVKLYPRLGCHPACPELESVYAFCASASIPVTSHASYRGFPDSMMRYADFGQPSNFEPALQAHPNLKLDLAHFGDRALPPDDRSWGDQIADLIGRYPQVYSDLACYTHQPALELFRDRYQALPRVRERTMFGSDFDVMYFTEPGMSLERYYADFLACFGPEDLGRMACQVPKEFLGI